MGKAWEEFEHIVYGGGMLDWGASEYIMYDGGDVGLGCFRAHHV